MAWLINFGASRMRPASAMVRSTKDVIMMEPIYGFSVYAPIKRTKTDKNVDYFTDQNGEMIFRFLSCNSITVGFGDTTSDVDVRSDLWDVS